MRASGPAGGTPLVEPCIAVYGARERVRGAVRAAFPKRRARLVAVRTSAELARVMRTELVDAVLVDLGAATEDAWAAAALAPGFPSAAFVAVGPLRATEGELLARCVGLGFADVLVDGVDDAAVRGVVGPLLFATRFAGAYADPPQALGIASPLQLAVWARIVESGGRLARTTPLAEALGVSREHLSRSFGTGAPPLKAVIDFVRVLAGAALMVSPGYHVRDVATVLGFATPSHFARATARIVGRAPSALAAATGRELIAAFAERSGASRDPAARRGARYEARGAPDASAIGDASAS